MKEPGLDCHFCGCIWGNCARGSMSNGSDSEPTCTIWYTWLAVGNEHFSTCSFACPGGKVNASMNFSRKYFSAWRTKVWWMHFSLSAETGSSRDGKAWLWRPSAPPGMYQTMQAFYRYLPCQLVQDFFHQQYHAFLLVGWEGSPCRIKYQCPMHRSGAAGSGAPGVTAPQMGMGHAPHAGGSGGSPFHSEVHFSFSGSMGLAYLPTKNVLFNTD